MSTPAFRIVIDTREQEPYEFPCEMVRRALPAGDYSVEGREGVVAVERKSLKDFVSTVIHDARRFGNELLLLSTYEAACVVVEGDIDAMLRGMRREDLRGARPESVLGATLYICVRYRVPVFWCGSRQAALAFTEGFLRMCARQTV